MHAAYTSAVITWIIKGILLHDEHKLALALRANTKTHIGFVYGLGLIMIMSKWDHFDLWSVCG